MLRLKNVLTETIILFILTAYAYICGWLYLRQYFREFGLNVRDLGIGLDIIINHSIMALAGLVFASFFVYLSVIVFKKNYTLITFSALLFDLTLMAPVLFGIIWLLIPVALMIIMFAWGRSKLERDSENSEDLNMCKTVVITTCLVASLTISLAMAKIHAYRLKVNEKCLTVCFHKVKSDIVSQNREYPLVFTSDKGYYIWANNGLRLSTIFVNFDNVEDVSLNAIGN